MPSVLLKLASESPGGLGKMQTAGSQPQNFWFSRIRVEPLTYSQLMRTLTVPGPHFKNHSVVYTTYYLVYLWFYLWLISPDQLQESYTKKSKLRYEQYSKSELHSRRTLDRQKAIAQDCSVPNGPTLELEIWQDLGRASRYRIGRPQRKASVNQTNAKEQEKRSIKFCSWRQWDDIH